MNSKDLVKMSVENLFRKKTRTILTVIGVIIGAASIVVMVSLGVGLNVAFMEQMGEMGSLHVINVHPQYEHHVREVSQGGAAGRRGEQVAKLDAETVAKLNEIAGVQAVMKILRRHFKFRSGRYEAHVSLMGINPEVMGYFDLGLEKGRLLTVEDTNAVVFGGQVPMQFRDPRARTRSDGGMVMRGGVVAVNGEFSSDKPQPAVDVLADSIFMIFELHPHHSGMWEKAGGATPGEAPPTPKRIRVTGVGLLDTEGFSEFSWGAFMNIDYLRRLIADQERKLRTTGQSNRRRTEETYDQVRVKVEHIKDVEEVQDKIRAMGFNTHSILDIVKEMQNASRIVQAVLGGIGAIAFFVAALGIANTMIMSIYERTREIGIMKVLGCKLVDIRNLFLLESAMIGLFGGIIGLLLSVGLSYLLNTFLGPKMGGGMPGVGPTTISVIPLWLAASAVVFSTMVGLMSGYFPARRAVQISALEAIKTE